MRNETQLSSVHILSRDLFRDELLSRGCKDDLKQCEVEPMESCHIKSQIIIAA